MTIEVRILGPGGETVLQNSAPDVFDNPVDYHLAAEFLRDHRHHLAVALDKGVVVGFASGVTYVHPDKPVELWINEVAVASSHRKQGIGKRILDILLEFGRAAGCREAWVLTDRSSTAATKLYESVGGTEVPGDTVMYSFALDLAPSSKSRS